MAKCIQCLGTGCEACTPKNTAVSESPSLTGLDSDELMASIQCYRVNYELNEWNKVFKDNPQMSLFLGACAAIKFLCDELEKRI
jgi:hypothetical protein